MEAALKKFNSAAEQYLRMHNTSHVAIELQSQLDALIKLTSSKSSVAESDGSCLLMTECITKLIMLIQDSDVKGHISQMIMTLFLNFSNIPALHTLLKHKFHLTATLASYLFLNSEREHDPSINQCLELLKCHTYKIEILYPEAYLDDLLAFLLHFIQKKPPHALRLSCLIVLANLCRKNSIVQRRIHKMEDRAGFYRYLLTMINSDKEHMLLISALSVFTSLAIDDDVGAKLFNPDNVHHTFVLIFALILQKDVEVICYAVDLFIDLLANEKMQHHLLCFKYFDDYIKKLLDLLKPDCNYKVVVKIYELLLEACLMNPLRLIIINLICQHSSCGSPESHPITVASHFLTKTIAADFDVSIQAAKFLNLLLKDFKVWQNHGLDRHLHTLVGCIADDLTSIWNLSNVDFDKACEKTVANLTVLKLLCKSGILKDDAFKPITVDMVQDVMKIHLNNDMQEKSLLRNSDCSSMSIDVILNTLNFMITVCDSVTSVGNLLHQYLQDSRVLCVLANALVSDSLENINLALELLFLSERQSGFPHMKFCQLLQKCSLHQKDVMENLKVPDIATPENGYNFALTKNPNRSVLAMRRNGDRSDPTLDVGMKSLIERMEKDWQVNDLKSSQIMEMYEHKISSLEMKERQLQDLLDAKTVSLQHSDRLLSQYRCRWAQSDAEALQLRNFLQEAEKRSEAAKEEATKAIMAQQALQIKLQKATDDALVLDGQIEELKDNNFAYNNKIETLQEKIERQKQENQSMIEFNTVLQRQNEEYKIKEEEMAEHISQIEKEKKRMTKQLKERDAKLNDHQKAALDLKNRYKKAEEEILRLKEDVSFNKNLVKTREEEYANLQGKLTGEQVKNSQMELKLEELQTELDKARAEYETCRQEKEKLKQITTMIHSMSSEVK